MPTATTPHTPRPSSAQDKSSANAATVRRRKARAATKARAAAKAQASRAAQAAAVAALPITNSHAAGVDIGQSSHWVCVGFSDDADRDAHLVREFPTHTQGLRDLVGYLREHQVTTVAVESTAFYWVPLAELLEQAGIALVLVHPSYTKQLRGRPKTDKRDAQWIFRLHSVGLLAGSFRPDARTRLLRGYLRQRATLVRYACRHIQHMQMALELMNVKLTTVLDDITGSTGQKILRAILKGTRDPHKLAALRHPRCKHSAAEMAQALDGSYQEEHLFALQLAYEAWQFCHKQIDKVDEKIRTQLQAMKSDRALPPLPPRPAGKRKPNDPRFDMRTALYYVVGLDLTEMEGISELTALTIVSEIGGDLSKFATVKHFTSWLGLCPNHHKTGGQVKSSRTRPGINRAAAALRLGASSLHSSASALGAYLRRMKSRLGAPAAVTATAHKLARLVYYALTHGMAYVQQSQQEYEAKIKQQQIKALKKKARRLGLEVWEKDAGVPRAAGGEAAPASGSS
jgi:transposase